MFMITKADKLPIRVQSAFVEFTETFKEAKALFLRRAFDGAALDSTALAVIRVAKAEGYYNLAREMEADYKSVTGKDVPC